MVNANKSIIWAVSVLKIGHDINWIYTKIVKQLISIMQWGYRCSSYVNTSDRLWRRNVYGLHWALPLGWCWLPSLPAYLIKLAITLTGAYRRETLSMSTLQPSLHAVHRRQATHTNRPPQDTIQTVGEEEQETAQRGPHSWASQLRQRRCRERRYVAAA